MARESIFANGVGDVGITTANRWVWSDVTPDRENSTPPTKRTIKHDSNRYHYYSLANRNVEWSGYAVPAVTPRTSVLRGDDEARLIFVIRRRSGVHNY